MGPKVKKLCHGLDISDIWITAVKVKNGRYNWSITEHTVRNTIRFLDFVHVLEVSFYRLGLGKQVGEYILS
jgi:hypothetical protein